MSVVSIDSLDRPDDHRDYRFDLWIETEGVSRVYWRSNDPGDVEAIGECLQKWQGVPYSVVDNYEFLGGLDTW